jgi:pimeloyl-ACP methyl ester carboxylesterase
MSSAARSLFYIFGLAGISLGVSLLSHPLSDIGLEVDISLAVFALWIGVRGTYDKAEPFQPGSLRRIQVRVASVLALVLAISLGGVSYWLHERKTDGSTVSVPTSVPKQPGKLISAVDYTTGVPDGARAWRILYTTTRDAGVPAVATALIIEKSAQRAGPRPVIAWAHGTTGIASDCAPSGNQDPARFSSIPGLTSALDLGWVVVATDYIGLGTAGPHPYLIGQGEGRSVLDAVRAAHQLSDVSLQTKTVIWGHSQGGSAALWAGMLAPTYAPSLDVVGVVGIAPASDLTALVDYIRRLPNGVLLAGYVITAYSQAYPDVHFDTYVRPAARAAVHAASGLCIANGPALLAVANSYNFALGYLGQDPLTGPLGVRLRQNTPLGKIAAPVLIAQGAKDQLVLETLQTAYVARRCAAHGNGPLDYRTYAGRDHVSIVAADSPLVPDLLNWTEGRFEGRPAPSTC